MRSLRMAVDLYGVSMVVMDLYRISMGHCGLSTGLYGSCVSLWGLYEVSMGDYGFLWGLYGFP